MNGAGYFIHKDIEPLILSLLEPRDQLLLSMTCKTFYAWFTPYERQFLSLNIKPGRKQESMKIKPERWTTCVYCQAIVLKENYEYHLRSVKCIRHAAYFSNNQMVCIKCMTPLSTKRYARHVKHCKGRYDPYACRTCMQAAHEYGYCPLKQFTCKMCQRNLPMHLFECSCRCEICDRPIYSRRYKGCLTCVKRCVNCDWKKCIFCDTLADPFREHDCPRVEYHVTKAINEQYGIPCPSWYPDYGYSNLWKEVSTGVEIYFVENVKNIPSMMMMHTWSIIMIFLGKTQLGMFSSGGDLFWIRSDVLPKIPIYCSWCMRTNAEKYFKCGRCNHDHYCDRECQRQDWKFHKVQCLE